ncbi:MAG: hypothetical protein IKM18_00360 [Clostridia bacterium]|nr:hypothetical protein [Clostridia bacterium]MBR3714342.1 hypothetical protein [Clostridia bacterium]
MTVNDICKEIKHRLDTVHIGRFKGMEKPLFLISEQYPGIWLEHVYDSVFYAMRDREKLPLAVNTAELFISLQKDDGQLPFCVLDGNKRDGELVGYSHIQECVSFAKLCFMIYEMSGDKGFLRRAFDASQKWVTWLRSNRMTLGTGLVEMFVGFDTGHDNSGRLEGLSCQGRYRIDGTLQNAAVLPKDDPTAPVIAVDMNCNYYATLTALSKMARVLGLSAEAKKFAEDATRVKKKLFEYCYSEEDAFFYDVDKNGRQMKYLSSTVFHLFMEGVLDEKDDAELIRKIYEKHISNPEEFNTPYPFPSMAISDPSVIGHKDFNCWGYYSQGLIALRATMWMDRYGFSSDFDRLCRAWVCAWTEHYDKVKLGQELDPVTGIPTRSSEWYSSCMLFYLFASERIGF